MAFIENASPRDKCFAFANYCGTCAAKCVLPKWKQISRFNRLPAIQRTKSAKTCSTCKYFSDISSFLVMKFDGCKLLKSFKLRKFIRIQKVDIKSKDWGDVKQIESWNWGKLTGVKVSWALILSKNWKRWGNYEFESITLVS